MPSQFNVRLQILRTQINDLTRLISDLKCVNSNEFYAELLKNGYENRSVIFFAISL